MLRISVKRMSFFLHGEMVHSYVKRMYKKIISINRLKDAHRSRWMVMERYILKSSTSSAINEVGKYA